MPRYWSPASVLVLTLGLLPLVVGCGGRVSDGLIREQVVEYLQNLQGDPFLGGAPGDS